MRNPTTTLKPSPVAIETAGGILPGELICPSDASGIVVLVREEPATIGARTRAVADMLLHGRIGTLIVQLTSEFDDSSVTVPALRDDIRARASGVVAAIDWLLHHNSASSLPIGLFAVSDTAPAVLVAASCRPIVRAVVSAGGRVDLAHHALDTLRAATLLIVGGRDDEVLELNRRALERLKPPVRLAIVPGASHHFEEPGALDRVSVLTANWFDQYLAGHEIHTK